MINQIRTPQLGWIVSCRFPRKDIVEPDDTPPRPTLIIKTKREGDFWWVEVVYGTGQSTSGTVFFDECPLHQIEVDPSQLDHFSAHLNEQTRFDFSQRVRRKWEVKWFPRIFNIPPNFGTFPRCLSPGIAEATQEGNRLLEKKPYLSPDYVAPKPEIKIRTRRKLVIPPPSTSSEEEETET